MTHGKRIAASVVIGAVVLLGLAFVGYGLGSSAGDVVLQAANEAAAEINRRAPMALPYYVLESAEVGPGRRFTYHVAWTSQAIPTFDAARFVQLLEPDVVRSICASAMRQISDAGWSIHYQYRIAPGPEFAQVDVRPRACIGTPSEPAAAPLVGQVIRAGRSFKGYVCSDDCQGHEAGYEWARDKGISDPADCTSESDSFNEGCEAAVIEAYDLEQEETHLMFEDQQNRY
ncbi:hypothetical protein [Tahibacter caeni]|uniref:hypothetical protein n=1 Tax=Tahibacter caeni TaxID=1453545 RepID=UPI0021483F22|nr:hypothetical protein [Tahibacter caeni]